MKSRGTVKWWDDKKGYGFLNTPEGEAFVHYTGIEMGGHKTLVQDAPVEFDLGKRDKGLYATNVKILFADPPTVITYEPSLV